MILRVNQFTTVLFVALAFVQSLAASPALETSHATHSAGGGGFVFVMHVDSSGEKTAYRGTCYSVAEGRPVAVWHTGGWYAYHGDLLLSEDGKYLVRIAPTTEERIKYADDLGQMPCMAVYKDGKLSATFRLSELVGDLGKVVRGPEFYLAWQERITLRGNMARIKTIDGAERSFDLSKGGKPTRKMDLNEAARKIIEFYSAEPGNGQGKNTKLKVSEYRIRDLWEEMGMQLFRLDRGASFSWNFLYADGQLTRVEIPTVGGAGLLDGVVHEKNLYLTSDWGSGIARTALYRTRLDKDDTVKTEELGVISSVGGRFDRKFLEDETVKKVMTLLRPLKQGRSVPVNPANLKPEGDLVFVEAFVGGLQRKVLAHKAYSADKKLFAGYYRDGFREVISIHDAKSGKQIRRIVGHGDDVRELKFTPDGQILASRCEKRGRRGWALWSVDSGELVLRLPVPPSDN